MNILAMMKLGRLTKKFGSQGNQ